MYGGKENSMMSNVEAGYKVDEPVVELVRGALAPRLFDHLRVAPGQPLPGPYPYHSSYKYATAMTNDFYKHLNQPQPHPHQSAG